MATTRETARPIQRKRGRVAEDLRGKTVTMIHKGQVLTGVVQDQWYEASGGAGTYLRVAGFPDFGRGVGVVNAGVVCVVEQGSRLEEMAPPFGRWLRHPVAALARGHVVGLNDSQLRVLIEAGMVRRGHVGKEYFRYPKRFWKVYPEALTTRGLMTGKSWRVRPRRAA